MTFKKKQKKNKQIILNRFIIIMTKYGSQTVILLYHFYKIGINRISIFFIRNIGFW